MDPDSCPCQNCTLTDLQIDGQGLVSSLLVGSQDGLLGFCPLLPLHQQLCQDVDMREVCRILMQPQEVL